MRKRKTISVTTRLRLIKECNSKCPICKNTDIDHFQIHHIDENPENDAISNLICLCPNCHSKVTKRDILKEEIEVLKIRLQTKKDQATPFIGRSVECQYPGGHDEFRKFLQQNLQYPQKALERAIEGVVTVKFDIDVTGEVINVSAISGPEELRSEAVRVIRKSARWLPAQQNGHPVMCYRKQPVTFQLEKSRSMFGDILETLFG